MGDAQQRRQAQRARSVQDGHDLLEPGLGFRVRS